MAHRFAPKDGVDLAALSPKDANAQRQPKLKAAELKTKTAAQLKAAKDKEHPAPPPAEVIEPASSDRPDGAVYQVGKLLGKGGFAICYGGQLLPTKSKFALKIVKSHMPPKMEQKFQTELQIHSKMRHKNIVQFFRAFAFESSTYLVLELCPNGSLMDMVKRRKGLTEPEVRFYTVQIAGAIKYMHGKGIIHRDLKMGNIFLDSRMNAKIGDFGLAALSLTGKDVQTIRRTTLCGTPNYIAPEILEKGKKGHDHMVDMWSLGIIVFAMLTSKPPFQSSTTDEIYRRARERDYEWPDVETLKRRISEEAKDLVSTMLTEADLRPEPDTVVQHPFFTSGYMPSEADMSVKLREFAPYDNEFYLDASELDLSRSMSNLKDMCRDCGVGAWGHAKVVHTQVWKEMAKEENAGLTPSIPLAKGVVYRPFDERSQEEQLIKPRLLASMAALSLNGSEEPSSMSTIKAPTGLLRQPPQSFAAQQRAQGRPSTTATSSKPRTALPTEIAPSTSGSLRVRTRKEPAAQREGSESGYRSLRGAPRTALPPSRSAPSLAVPDKAVANTPAPISTGQKQIADTLPSASLFSPTERPTQILGTKPDDVLERLRRLQTELERALNSRSMAIISSKTTTPPHPHIVVKWVDYTNKFGLGYILNDGSVGCVLRDIATKTESGSTAQLPPAGVFIRGAERHILRRQDSNYANRHQPVPMTQPIKFFENNGERGLSQATISPEQFRVPINDDGTAGKLNPGKDSYQHRKRERIILWKKFANYMIAYGRDEAVPTEEDVSKAVGPGQENAQAELVTFYQRFGDVGCWVYCDGHLQFNFPDHTKIVLDATGTWCHFWHLPQEAAERLASTGTIGAAALDDRAMLSYPLQTLLNFQTKSTARAGTTRRRPEIDPELQGIPAANDFRRKIDFIKNVVKEWVTNGGLGNSHMSRETRLRWLGYRETVNATIPQKHVWVTIGARWGDQRLTSLVDPRAPWELGEDTDSASKK